MAGGWYDDMLSDSSVTATTKTLTEPLALKPSSINKLDEKGAALSEKYRQYVEGTFVTDSAKVQPDRDHGAGVRRSGVRSGRSGGVQRQELGPRHVQILRAAREGRRRRVHAGERVGTVDEPDIITEAEGGPISLAVTYAHRGEEFVVTYSLADSTPVTFPPTKPIADSSENRAVTKLSVLSASFGSWFSSEDNADVTDIITWLLGPERDFYAAAGIRQYVWCIVQYLRTQGRSATGQADPIGTIMDDAGADDDVHSVYSDTDLEIKAPTAPIVYKGTALLNLLADKKWPLSTNVACWWCCHTFTNIPCPLPVAYKDGKGFLVKGCFCSFNCAKAYNSREGGVSRELTNSHLFLMTQRLWYKSHKGVPFPGVVTAPARACLKMFGGYMDIDQFRAASHTHIHMTREPPYPMEVIQQVDCANAISKQRYALTQSASVKNSAVTDEKASRKATELDNRKRTRQEGVLSLKRAKPMVSKGCSLDKFVNIKAKSNQK
eukprot:jgi/Mesvir1/3818/Mv04951-RA.1